MVQQHCDLPGVDRAVPTAGPAGITRQRSVVDRLPGRLENENYALIADLVRNTDDGGVADAGQLLDDQLVHGRIDRGAAAQDYILSAPQKHDRSVTEDRQVTRRVLG